MTGQRRCLRHGNRAIVTYGFPSVSLSRVRARPAGRKPTVAPGVQVRMLGRPRQHGAGYAEIVEPSGQAFVDDARLFQSLPVPMASNGLPPNSPRVTGASIA
jgi:hypothetical protein